MRIRPLEKTDLLTVAMWFADKKWPMPGADGVLPQGFVAENDSHELVACAFVYTTKTAFSYLSWMGSDERLPQDMQTQGLRLVIGAIQKLCERVDPKITVLMTHTKSDAMARTLKDLGFRADPGYYHMTWLAPA